MGYDAPCRLTLDGRTIDGKASLEQHQLVFRGDTRVAVDLKSATDVQAADGRLSLTSGGRRHVFHLGDHAGTWARRITNPPSRAAKLGIKPGLRAAFVNMKDDGLAGEIEECGAVLETRSGARDLDLVFFGASTPDDLDRIAAAAARLHPAGALWVIRAKGPHATIKEAASMAAGKRAGLVDVKVVSFSDSASAEKYVVPRALRPPTAATSAPARRSGAAAPRRPGSASPPARRPPRRSTR